MISAGLAHASVVSCRSTRSICSFTQVHSYLRTWTRQAGFMRSVSSTRLFCAYSYFGLIHIHMAIWTGIPENEQNTQDFLRPRPETGLCHICHILLAKSSWRPIQIQELEEQIWLFNGGTASDIAQGHGIGERRNTGITFAITLPQ